MAKRLSGQQVLDIIFGEDSDPEDIESSEDENLSSGSEFRFDEDDEISDDDTIQESEENSSDSETLYSIVDTPSTSTNVSSCFISKNLMERWLPNAQTVRQSRAQNVIKGRLGPTSFAKQRVSDDTPEMVCFLVFFCHKMLDHVVSCTNIEGTKIKHEQWKATSQVELRAFIGLLLLRGVYKASGESTEELWSADGRRDFPSTMSFNRFVHYIVTVNFFYNFYAL